MVVTDCYTVLDDDGSAPTVIVLRFPQAEMDALQASYDPNSGTSPSAAVSRPIVRDILDAVRAATPPVVNPDPQ